MSISGGLSVGGLALINNFLGLGGQVAGVTILVLDAKNFINPHDLANVFALKYPFVDNREALLVLAQTVNNKAPVNFKDGPYMINLPEEETRMAISSADLSEEQLQIIINDLK